MVHECVLFLYMKWVYCSGMEMGVWLEMGVCSGMEMGVLFRNGNGMEIYIYFNGAIYIYIFYFHVIGHMVVRPC